MHVFRHFILGKGTAMKIRSLPLASLASLLFLSSCGSIADTAIPVRLLGDPAPASAATRTIVITPDTRYVNTEGGETVTFVANGQSFTWNFAPQGSLYFALNEIAPAGMLDHRVMASVAAPQRYLPNW
jgi:hypothetical protein